MEPANLSRLDSDHLPPNGYRQGFGLGRRPKGDVDPLGNPCNQKAFLDAGQEEKGKLRMSNTAKNRGGRPRKSPLERRTVAMTPRYTEIEAAVIRNNAANIGISATEYVYRSTVKDELNVPTRRTADPHLITRLNRLAIEVRDLGQNVNQIATYMHSDRRVPLDWDEVKATVDRLQSEISAALDNTLGE